MAVQSNFADSLLKVIPYFTSTPIAITILTEYLPQVILQINNYVSSVCCDTFTTPVYRQDVGKGAVPMINPEASRMSSTITSRPQ